MDFSKDFGSIGGSYGNWQKYAGLGDKFVEEITGFPAPSKAPVAPPAEPYATNLTPQPANYSLGQMPSGLGVPPRNTFGVQPSLNQGFAVPTQEPSLLDSVHQYYGVNDGR